MSHSFLIVDPYYPAFLRDFYSTHPEVHTCDYVESRRALMDECFGTADFYSRNLELLGHYAVEVVPNDLILQGKWARENGLRVRRSGSIDVVASRVRYLRRLVHTRRQMLKILAAQITAIRPEILYFQDLSWCEPDLIEQIRPVVRLVVGQIACPMPADVNIHTCDLVLSSFPHYVERLRAMGVASEYFRLGFETSVLDRLHATTTPHGAVFVGGISRLHMAGNAALERLAAEVDLETWGYGFDTLPAESPLRRSFKGFAWGLNMYDILHSSRIAINRHIEVAEACANNARLYEATGSGALLITDQKSNLGELFEIEKEVVAYHDAEDLIRKIKYYLGHEEERAAIAGAGQKRTLADHTYFRRMQELEQIVGAYL